MLPKFEAHTTVLRPPIPTRDFDYMAYNDFNHESGPYGYGASRAAAVHNLISDFVERYEEMLGNEDYLAAVARLYSEWDVSKL